MTVFLVGAGPGDPGLLTRRGAEVLAEADVVVHDRLVDPAVLSLARPGALLVDVGTQLGPAAGAPASPGAASSGAARQAEVHRLLIAHGRTGRTVVRLKVGDPFVFGRGSEEAEALHDAGVPWEVVPGVSSAFAVPACAGVPITHRGLSPSTTVVTGHVGDLGAPGSVDWEALGRAGGTLVVLMGMATRDEIARRLLAAGRSPGTPVAVVQWGTTPAQRVERTTLAELGSVRLGPPAVIVIGAVAGFDLLAPGGRPLAGVTAVVTRPRARSGPLASSLASAGARVIELPVIETAEPEDGGAALRRAAGELGGYDWVVLTSATAADALLGEVRDARLFGSARLAAVGKATAAALARHHLVADVVPDRSSAEGVVAELPPAPGGGGRVLFPAAAGARETVPAGLRAKGWEVDVVVAYRTAPVPVTTDETAELLEEADVVTFASPSAVAAYLAMRTTSGRNLVVPPAVACIGPTTAAAARRSGLAVAVESPDPSPDAFTAAIAGYVAAREGRPAPIPAPPAP